MPTEAVALALASVAALLASWDQALLPKSAILLTAVVAWISLQLLPVPAAVHAISPSTNAALRATLGAIGRYPSARPFTLDLPATAREVCKALACLLAFIAASSFSWTQRRKSDLLRALALSGCITAAAALGLTVLGFQPLFAPKLPFVNRNHLAGLLNLTAFVSLGFALRERGERRLGWVAAFALSTLGIFASLSRGGAAAYFFGLAVFVVRYFTGGRRRAAGRAPVLAGILALVVGLAGFLALGPLSQRVASAAAAGSEEFKTRLWPAAVEICHDFPLTGIGRGAFATVFPSFRTDPATFTYSHLENEWLQLPIELGIPVAALLLAVLWWVWLRAAIRADLTSPEVGVLAGVAAIGAAVIVDFSTELLGVAVPLSVSLGLLARSPRPFAIPRALLRGGIVVSGLAGGVALVWSGSHGDNASSRIASAPLAEVPSVAATEVDLRPLDYLPHAAAGARLVAAGDCPAAMPWLVRAMSLAPGMPGPHLDAGRCMTGPLARREYQLAFALGRYDALVEAVGRWPTLDNLLQATPATPDGLLALGALLTRERPSDARVVLARVLNEFADERALLPLAEAYLASGDNEEALRLARQRRDVAPTDESAYWLGASVLFRMSRSEEGIAELERGIVALPGSPLLLGLLAEHSLRRGHFAQAKVAADRISARSEDEVAMRDLLASKALAGMGRFQEAIGRARDAINADPARAAPLLQLARACLGAGRFEDALEALERARKLPGAQATDYADLESEIRARASSRVRLDAAQMSDDPPLRQGEE